MILRDYPLFYCNMDETRIPLFIKRNPLTYQTHKQTTVIQSDIGRDYFSVMVGLIWNDTAISQT